MDLAQTFGFSAQELAENRAGKRSIRQMNAIGAQVQRERFWKRISVIAICLPLIGMASLILFNVSPPNQEPRWMVIWTVMGFVALVLTIFFAALIRGNMRSDLAKGTISVVEGYIHKFAQKMPRKSLGTAYFLHIQEVKFQVDTKRKFEAIEQNAVYRIHYIKHPPTQWILSIEQIG